MAKIQKKKNIQICSLTNQKGKRRKKEETKTKQPTTYITQNMAARGMGMARSAWMTPTQPPINPLAPSPSLNPSLGLAAKKNVGGVVGGEGLKELVGKSLWTEHTTSEVCWILGSITTKKTK